MMKLFPAFWLSILVVFIFGTYEVRSDAKVDSELDPKNILSEVESSANDSMSLSEKLQISLELAHYYDKMKQPQNAQRIYENMVSSLWSSSTRDLIANSGYVTNVADHLENAGTTTHQPALIRSASQLREELLHRTLNDPLDDSQNMSANSMGFDPTEALIAGLGKAPEFKGLLTATVNSFSSDRADLQSLRRAKLLSKLIQRNRQGLDSQNQDDVADLRTRIEDTNEYLNELKAQVIKNDEIDQQISDAQRQLDKLTLRLKKSESKLSPCWTDPRIDWENPSMKGFTCAAASLSAHEDLTSADALFLIRKMTSEKPFSQWISDCHTEFQIQARENAIAKKDAELASGAPPIDCDIPDDLRPPTAPQSSDLGMNGGAMGGGGPYPGLSGDVFTSSGSLGGGVVGSGGLIYASSSQKTISVPSNMTCDSYMKERRDEKKNIEVSLHLSDCSGVESSDEFCFLEIENEASTLPDSARYPIINLIAQKEAQAGLLKESRVHIEQVLSALDGSPELDSQNTSGPMAAWKRSSLIYGLDSTLGTYITASGSGKSPVDTMNAYKTAIEIANSVREPGLRNILLLHALEKFTEQRNRGVSFSQITGYGSELNSSGAGSDF